MNIKKQATWIAVTLAIFAGKASGHGTPINVHILPTTGQLAVFDGYDPGILESFGGSDIFTDEPGIGISSPFNGFQPGDELSLNVLQGLLFWNGADVVTTAETLTIEWPDDGGISPVESYLVSAQSAYQTGMLWGKYLPPGGNGSWDAHGDYSLGATNPAVGIYGLVLQITKPDSIASEPFLLPLVYDPASSLGAVKIIEGITDLQQSVLTLPTADFNRDTRVDATDLGIWEIGFGASSDAFQVQGDATSDGAITGEDFLAWQRQFSEVSQPNTAVSSTSVPEPATISLTILMAMSCVARRRSQA